MSEASLRYTGGCLCGAVRYEAVGIPSSSGHCYCRDCQRASGSGFIPFLVFARSVVRFQGETRQFRSPAARGGEAVRNFCRVCGSLVFGGETDRSESFTIYAGSLDDSAMFRPTLAIFERDRPAWALLPPGLTVFERLPPAGR